MRDIADACGLLAGSLYSHFKSKSEILQLILDPFYDQLIPAQEAAAALEGTGVAQTEEMLRLVFRVLAAYNEEMTIIHYDWQDLLGMAEFADILDRSNYALELWHRVIVAGIADGTLRPEIDSEVTVRVITSSLHGVLDRKRYGARPNPLTEVGLDGLVDEFVLMMVSGLRSDGPLPAKAAAKVTGKTTKAAGRTTKAAGRTTKAAGRTTKAAGRTTATSATKPSSTSKTGPNR
jgi:AcrR family transcriptional regulator